MSKRKPKYPVYTVVGIDPGASAGVAVVHNGVLVASRPAVGSEFPTLYQAVKEAMAGHDISLENVVGVVEQGWVTKGWGSKGALTLAQRRGIAQSAMEANGITRIEYVYSSTWMNEFYGGIHGKNTKELSTTWFKATTGRDAACDDEADAAAMASWSYTKFTKE